MVLDGFKRKIAGWAVSGRRTMARVQAGLHLAGATGGERKVILPADQGSHSTALAYSQQSTAAGIQRCMGAVGNDSDNALAESCSATLEYEWLQRAQWANVAEAEAQLCLYLEGFYNRRRHAAVS